jgi:hypothetical protein
MRISDFSVDAAENLFSTLSTDDTCEDEEVEESSSLARRTTNESCRRSEAWTAEDCKLALLNA